MKWYVAIPPTIITLLAALHFKEIFNLAISWVVESWYTLRQG